MNRISRIDFINIINDFALSEDYRTLINTINEILSYDDFSEYFELLEMAFDSAQLYGFFQYLPNIYDVNKINIKSLPYKAYTLPYMNSGQLSLLYDISELKKVFISAPTSFGKTSIINEFIIINESKLHNVVYIVPTNSLLEEIYSKFTMFNKKYNLDYYITTRPKLKEDTRNFLILTPERFLLLVEDYNINKFDLILMDEAYKIIEFKKEKITDFYDDRSNKFRKVSEIIASSQNIVIFLSPYTYSETESMNLFFHKYNIKKLNRELSYVNHYIIPLYNGRQFKKNFNYQYIGYGSTSTIKKASILLPFIQSEKNIVYVSSYGKAYEIVSNYVYEGQNPESERFLAFLDHLNKNYNVKDLERWKVIEGLEKGIGIYISPIPRYIKKEIVSLFESEVLHTLIVTTSFTEGVNTSAKNLIMTSRCTASSIRLSDLDILNVIGRAGRFAKNSIGNVYCIDKDVYDYIVDLRNNINYINLDNLNYIKENNKNDYEIDMIDNRYLEIGQLERKQYISQIQNDMNLTNKELNISLNVSKMWKLILYDYFLSLQYEEVYLIYDNIINIKGENKNNLIESIYFIFETIRLAFIKNTFDSNIDPFKTKVYEINAFSRNNEFTWGKLYKIYSTGNIGFFIQNNRNYVIKRFNKVINKYNLERFDKKDDVKNYFKNENLGWLLDKYYDSNLKIKPGIFYTEVFKIISNIFEYKIPFYIGFFVSIFKLYFNKNIAKDDIILQIDVKEIALQFENGISNNEYNELIDFGIPSDLIKKLKNKNIKLEEIYTNIYTKEELDLYEQIILNDFVEKTR